MEYQEVKFIDKSHLQSLADFHRKNGELFDGMQVYCERNYRTPLIEATLKSWSIGSVKSDITGLGKYSVSSAIVIREGKEESWPFSMLYVKK